MPYEGEAIGYRFKHLSLPGNVAMLYVSVDEAEIALLEGNRELWGVFLANAVKRHGQHATVGVLKVGGKTYVPDPMPSISPLEWDLIKAFAENTPAEDEGNWLLDSGTATR